MKKFLAVLLAGVMVLGGAVTAFAAPSPSASAGKAVNGLVADVTGDADKTQIEVTDDKSFTDAEVLEAAKGLGIDTSNLTVYFNGDIHMINTTTKEIVPFDGTATVTFNVPGMTKSSTGYVLHYKDGAWKDVTSSKGQNVIAGTFNGFSPMAILVDKSTLNKDAASSSAKKSPKTGEAPFTATMLGIIAVAAVGMIVSRRKFA